MPTLRKKSVPTPGAVLGMPIRDMVPGPPNACGRRGGEGEGAGCIDVHRWAARDVGAGRPAPQRCGLADAGALVAAAGPERPAAGGTSKRVHVHAGRTLLKALSMARSIWPKKGSCRPVQVVIAMLAGRRGV